MNTTHVNATVKKTSLDSSFVFFYAPLTSCTETTRLVTFTFCVLMSAAGKSTRTKRRIFTHELDWWANYSGAVGDFNSRTISSLQIGTFWKRKKPKIKQHSLRPLSCQFIFHGQQQPPSYRAEIICSVGELLSIQIKFGFQCTQSLFISNLLL